MIQTSPKRHTYKPKTIISKPEGFQSVQKKHNKLQKLSITIDFSETQEEDLKLLFSHQVWAKLTQVTHINLKISHDVWGFMIRFMQRLTTLRHLQDIRIIIPE